MRQASKVSVCMIAYNHEKFIEEAIYGVLMQKHDFEVEVVIVNDCSSDRTNEVIQNIINTDPRASIINYINHDRNIGIIPNFNFALKQCKGEYIAICEGDDYWTDPYKLQKQVDFLETHPSYFIHSGKAQVLNGNILVEEASNRALEPKTYDIKDFYTVNRVYTCTVMFRNTSRFTFDFENKLFGDWILYISLLSSNPGNLAYVSNEIYAVYRIHSGGAMQTVSQFYKNAEAQLTHIFAINKFIKCEYSEKDIYRINDYCLVIFSHYLKFSQYKKCINIIYKNIKLVKYHISVKGYSSLLFRKIIPKD
ncbi:glycosyltransferase family 2 protein [Salegentibacter sp. HM20]